jgi:hypothetical protein
MKSTLKPYHNKLKALFAQHIQSNVEDSQSEDEPITEQMSRLPLALSRLTRRPTTRRR